MCKHIVYRCDYCSADLKKHKFFCFEDFDGYTHFCGKYCWRKWLINMYSEGVVVSGVEYGIAE